MLLFLDFVETMLKNKACNISLKKKIIFAKVWQSINLWKIALGQVLTLATTWYDRKEILQKWEFLSWQILMTLFDFDIVTRETNTI